MTHKASLIASIVASLSIFPLSPAPLFAEGRARLVQSQNVDLGSIRDAIIRAIGARDGTVEVATVGNVLRVYRINSSMNKTGHGARNNEAATVGSVTAQAISSKSEFSKIHTIRIQYVARANGVANERIIDTIDLRKDAAGIFQFHAT